MNPALLRAYEKAGLMPRFGSVPVEGYRARVAVIVAARRRLSMQVIRRGLAAGGC